MPVPEGYTFSNKPRGISMSDGHWNDTPVDGITLFHKFIAYYQENVAGLLSSKANMTLSEGRNQ